MLKQRIITALILAPIVVAGIFLLPLFEFSLFIGAIIAIGAWEWAGLAGFEGRHRFVYAGLIALLLALSDYLPPLAVLLCGALWWLVALVLVVAYPGATNLWSSRGARALIGIFLLVPGWTGLVVLKAGPDSNYLILLLFFLIWGADIGAYFAGRAFGRRKLAPRVSPGKSWAGFYGGLVSSLIIAALMSLWMGKPALVSITGVIFLAGCALVVMVSVLGDLAESMFKRHRGIKDSSSLLPGHGGVLDRIDSLLSAGPLFALFIMVFQWT